MADIIALYIPQFGVIDAYGTDAKGLDNALGIYLSAWAIVTLIFLIASLRSSIALISLFFFLEVTFWLLYVPLSFPLQFRC
jgi:succinate-acetate transporter protein